MDSVPFVGVSKDSHCAILCSPWKGIDLDFNGGFQVCFHYAYMANGEPDFDSPGTSLLGCLGSLEH